MKKILFLPHCMRNIKICVNNIGEDGFICDTCKDILDCSVGRLKKMAEKLGFLVYCVPGGSLFIKIFERELPKIVVGIACNKEIDLALKYLKNKKNLIVEHIALSSAGCVNTKVNELEVEKVLNKYATM